MDVIEVLAVWVSVACGGLVLMFSFNILFVMKYILC